MSPTFELELQDEIDELQRIERLLAALRDRMQARLSMIELGSDVRLRAALLRIKELPPNSSLDLAQSIADDALRYPPWVSCC